MFSRTMRNAPRSMRFLSTRSAASHTSTAASRKNLYLGTVAATAGLAAYGYTSVFGDRARVWNEDLKVNRHKVAAAQGKTPDTPLNNEATTANSLHIDTSDPAQQAAGGITAKPSSESSSTSGKEPKVLKDKAEQAKNEENSEGQSAYNEETGEINWDCPCLGGMADGPCGEDFKAAFSCFVHSDAEPKGLDCVEKFKAMQDCFRKHPDIYGEEIDDDQEEGTSVNETRVKVDENASADTKQPKKPTDDHPDTPQKLDTGLTNPSKMGTRGPGGIASSSGR